jgi:hypothetical protein
VRIGQRFEHIPHIIAIANDQHGTGEVRIILGLAQQSSLGCGFRDSAEDQHVDVVFLQISYHFGVDRPRGFTGSTGTPFCAPRRALVKKLVASDSMSRRYSCSSTSRKMRAFTDPARRGVHDIHRGDRRLQPASEDNRGLAA